MGIYQNKYTLKFLPDAYAWVDPIKTLHGLLGQRKRWINGSYFAFERVKQSLTSTDKCHLLLNLQMLFLNFMNILSFISPALFMFTVHLATVTWNKYLIQFLRFSNIIKSEGP
jgi:chitin synthase